MKIELNEQEALVLRNLLDVVLKAAGLQAMEAVSHFVKKLDEAAKPDAAVANANEVVDV